MGQWCRRIYGKTGKTLAFQHDVAAALAFLGHYFKTSVCHCLACSQCRLSHAPLPLQGIEVEGNLCHFTKATSFFCIERKRKLKGSNRTPGHSRPGWKENSGKSWHSCVSFTCNGRRWRADGFNWSRTWLQQRDSVFLLFFFNIGLLRTWQVTLQNCAIQTLWETELVRICFF